MALFLAGLPSLNKSGAEASDFSAAVIWRQSGVVQSAAVPGGNETVTPGQRNQGRAWAVQKEGGLRL